ncbi:unnamed protein product [Sphagnum compactum]
MAMERAGADFAMVGVGASNNGDNNNIDSGGRMVPHLPMNPAQTKAEHVLCHGEFSSQDAPSLGKRFREDDEDSLTTSAPSGFGGSPQQGLSSVGGRPRVRARRGQATDPHSIAERLRRERIAERMKALQELVPNSNKTDKASMLDEIIDYVKFLQLQVKILSMSRLGGAGAVAPTTSDLPAEGSNNMSATISHSSGTPSPVQDGIALTERQVTQLMEDDMGSAMQYLQSKGLCLMPIALATAISTTNNSRGAQAGIVSAAGMKTSSRNSSCTVLTDKTNESLTPSSAMAKAGNRVSLEGSTTGSKQQQQHPLFREASPVIQAEVKEQHLATIPSAAQLSSFGLQSCDSSSSPDITRFLSEWVGIDVEDVGSFDEDEDDNDSLPDIDQSDEVCCAELRGSSPCATTTHEQEDVPFQSSRAEKFSPTIKTLGRASTLMKSPVNTNVVGEEEEYQIQSIVIDDDQITEAAEQ